MALWALMDLSSTLESPTFWTALAAVGTVGAFVAAFWQIWVERSARQRSEREAQALRVSAWWAGENATVLNASTTPVYRLVVWLVTFQGGGGPRTGEEIVKGFAGDLLPATVSVLPPGRYSVPLPPFEGGMSMKPAVELGFTDAAGRHWIRRGDGRLERIRLEPALYYGIGLPQDWAMPTPATTE
jgi:hypothetical protein